MLEWTERIARPADAAKSAAEHMGAKPATATTVVTGATGFIGRHLMKRLLTQNQRIRIVARRDPPAELANHPLVEVVRGDLADPATAEQALAGCKLVYHLAGPMGTGDPNELQRGMVATTRNVVESALKHQVPKLIYMGSLSVLHNAAAAGKAATIKEDWPLDPYVERRGAYSQTKLEAEKIVLDAVKQRGLKAIILRPGTVLGAGTHVLPPEVARRAKGRLVILGNGDLALPLICVEDLVEAILLAVSSDRFDGSVYHLVSPEKFTQNDYVKEYLRVTGDKAGVVHIPMPVVYTLALGVQTLAGVLRRPAPLSIYRLQSSLTPLNFDCSAAEKGLGWKPKVSLRQGVAATLEAGKA